MRSAIRPLPAERRLGAAASQPAQQTLFLLHAAPEHVGPGSVWHGSETSQKDKSINQRWCHALNHHGWGRFVLRPGRGSCLFAAKPRLFILRLKESFVLKS